MVLGQMGTCPVACGGENAGLSLGERLLVANPGDTSYPSSVAFALLGRGCDEFDPPLLDEHLAQVGGACK